MQICFDKGCVGCNFNKRVSSLGDTAPLYIHLIIYVYELKKMNVLGE